MPASTYSVSAGWSAPTATGPLSAVVPLPGSKSLTNRELVLSALAHGPSTLRRPLVARDTELMVDALVRLGATVERTADGDLRIQPGPVTGGTEIDCGLAGTVMRFLPPVAVLADGPVRFDGDPRARSRPMATTILSLRALGAEVDDDGRGTLPFTVHGGHPAGGRVMIDASESSQFVSGLLLVGARLRDGILIEHRGSRLPSMPHIAMTIAALSARKVHVVVPEVASPGAVWIVEPHRIAGRDVVIEPDLSNAAPFLALAAANGGSVTVRDWPHVTTQAGDALRDLLTRMGCVVDLGDHGLTVTGPERLTGLDADLHDVGELTPVIAALCALADSPSVLRGIAHIRGHETDRLAALARELGGLGADVVETDDGLSLRPARLHGGLFHTYADHRMAHAGAVVGSAVDDVLVEDIATTSKTFPGFPDAWRRLL
jgi:3-phosphoshikimate 1-carboxyvinyltransferase